MFSKFLLADFLCVPFGLNLTVWTASFSGSAGWNVMLRFAWFLLRLYTSKKTRTINSTIKAMPARTPAINGVLLELFFFFDAASSTESKIKVTF